MGNVKAFVKQSAEQTNAALAWVKDLGTALLLWLAFVLVPWREIRAEGKSTSNEDFPDGEYEASQAEFLFVCGRQDSDHTDDKAKHLLGLGSALAAVIVVFAPEVSPEWLAFAPTVPLLFSVVLCIRQLGVRTEMVPVPEPKETRNTRDPWPQDILKSYRHNERQRLFLVDLFSAARRWLLLALVLLVVVAARRDPLPEPAASESAELRRTLEGHQVERNQQFEVLRASLDSALSTLTALRRDGPLEAR